MSIDELVLILSVGLLSLAALGVGIAAAYLSSRQREEAATTADLGRPGMPSPDDPSTEADGDLVAPRRAVRDRVVRVVALSYLVAVAVVVAVSGGWGANAPSVYLLVALGTLAVVFLGDLLPGAVSSTVRSWAEGAAAITLVTAIVGLTGGVFSPFSVGYFLIVGAAAMSRDTHAAIAIALVSAFASAAIDLVVWPTTEGLWSSVAPVILFQGLGLVLLATIVAIASREHQRAQDATLRLARFDPLTGLYNRTHFFTELEREIRLAQRAGRTFALLMLDVDGLKPVNDAFGHHYGDRLLTGVTGVIRNTVRATDTPARYGGDEFLVLLPETDAAGAFVVAEKLRHDIAAFTIQVSDRTVRTTVSVGLVAYPEDGTTVDALMASADAALYEAKRTGRDRIVGYTTRMERVATPMGGAERRVVTPIVSPVEPVAPSFAAPDAAAAPMAPSQPAVAPSQPAVAPSQPPVTPMAPSAVAVDAPPATPVPSAPVPPPEAIPTRPRVVSAGPAPWVTGTNADWETRGRARVAVPIEPGDQASRGPSGRSV